MCLKDHICVMHLVDPFVKARGAHTLRFAGKHSTKVNWAFGPARSFSIVNPKGRKLKSQLYSSELSYRDSLASPSPAKVLPYWEFCTVLRPPPLKTVQKICSPRRPNFLYSFEGGDG